MATLEDLPVDIWHVILQDNEYKLVHNPHYAPSGGMHKLTYNFYSLPMTDLITGFQIPHYRLATVSRSIYNTLCHLNRPVDMHITYPNINGLIRIHGYISYIYGFTGYMASQTGREFTNIICYWEMVNNQIHGIQVLVSKGFNDTTITFIPMEYGLEINISRLQIQTGLMFVYDTKQCQQFLNDIKMYIHPNLFNQITKSIMQISKIFCVI